MSAPSPIYFNGQAPGVAERRRQLREQGFRDGKARGRVRSPDEPDYMAAYRAGKRMAEVEDEC